MGKMYSRVCKKNDKDYPVNVEYYNSANDVVDDLMLRKLKPGGWHEPSTDSSWTGCKNFDEALEFLRTGYYPVVEKLEREVKIANQQTCEGKRITFKNNILGYNPIVPLAMMGVPNSMIDMTMKPIKTKVVDIYYDMTANCGVESDDIINAGLSVLSVICDLCVTRVSSDLSVSTGMVRTLIVDTVIVTVMKSVVSLRVRTSNTLRRPCSVIQRFSSDVTNW